MAAVTARHIVMHDLRLNSVPKNFAGLCRYMAKYAVSLLFIILANVAIGFFISSVTDVSLTPAAARGLNSPCILAGAFDAHDTWHLLSALSLTLWVMALLDMKLRMFKRCVTFPSSQHITIQRRSVSASCIQELKGDGEAWRLGI